MDVEAAILNVTLLILLTVPHEYAHAWVAEKLGDDTPRLEGRVTLYPLAHIDWLGTVILPAITSLMGAGFLGWGRPVNTNPARLRWGMNGLLLVALAGPVSNVILAVLLAFPVVLSHSVAPLLAEFLARGIPLSLYLALFNMIPVPPLDGSKLLLAMRIPPVIYVELARFGFILVLLAMSYTGIGRWMSYWSIRGATGILALFGV